MPVHPFHSADNVIVIPRHGDKILFLPIGFQNPTEAGFGYVLPKARLQLEEDTLSAAQRIIAETLKVQVPLEGLRYIGSVACAEGRHLQWIPLMQAQLPLASRPRKHRVLPCALSALDALLASGGLAQAESLAAVACYGAKLRTGLLD